MIIKNLKNIRQIDMTLIYKLLSPNTLFSVTVNLPQKMFLSRKQLKNHSNKNTKLLA